MTMRILLRRTAMLRFAVFGCLLAISPAHSRTETVVGRVVGVSDGDTLSVIDAHRVTHKIRLAGIDAPEKKQDFGQKAKLSLSGMVFNEVVDADCRKIDRYERRICVVSIKGVDVGLAQVRAGLAWWYRQYAREQTASERNGYEQAEQQARQRRIGLWSLDMPTPPWEWRRR